MDEDKEVHRVKIVNITPQDISARNILGEYIISRDYEKTNKVNRKATSSSKIL
jgi:hypothetical protein